MTAITLDTYQLEQMLQLASELGSDKALRKAGINKETQISQSEAYRRYTRTRVTKWILTGKIKIVKSGKTNLLDAQSLEDLSKIQELKSNHL